VHSADPHLVAEALEVVRHLIQRDPTRHAGTVVRLAKNLDSLTSASARASVVWLVGEFAGLVPVERSVAPDVLRILVRGYADEADEVRQQIVLLAAKVYLHWLNGENARTKEGRKDKPLEPAESSTMEFSGAEDDGGFRDTSGDATKDAETPPQDSDLKQHAISLLYHHTLLLARYTPSYDLRDRARLFRALLSVPSSTELASLLLLAPKPVPQAPSPSESRAAYVLGSSSLVIGDEAGVSGLKGYEGLPEWVVEGEEPDGKLRDAEGEGGATAGSAAATARPAGRMLDQAVSERPVSGAGAGGNKDKTLDSWLAESEGEDSEEGEDESEDESEEESEESEEESEEDSEEESEVEESEEDEKGRLVK